MIVTILDAQSYSDLFPTVFPRSLIVVGVSAVLVIIAFVAVVPVTRLGDIDLIQYHAQDICPYPAELLDGLFCRSQVCASRFNHQEDTIDARCQDNRISHCQNWGSIKKYDIGMFFNLLQYLRHFGGTKQLGWVWRAITCWYRPKICHSGLVHTTIQRRFGLHKQGSNPSSIWQFKDLVQARSPQIRIDNHYSPTALGKYHTQV